MIGRGSIVWSVAVLSCLLRLAGSELVQIVTPERVHVVTPAGSETDVNVKRETPKNRTMDSYLAALSESQGAASRYDSPKPTNGYEHSPPHHEAYEPYYEHEEVNSYGPPQGYQPSKPSYHTPSIPYGPPSPMTYLPPSAPIQPSPFYGIPFAASHSMVMSALQNLMPKGIDLETVFKLLLKFVLFKMIVKFIAVTCLLLAYPLFQSKNKEDDAMDEDEDKRRQFDALNDLTALVWDSVFQNNQTDNRDKEHLVEKVAGVIDDKMTAPSEEAAIGFLEFCVAAANTVVGWMMSFVRRRNNEMDPLEQLLWSIWEKMKRALITMPS